MTQPPESLPPCLIVSVDTEEEFDWSAAGVTRAWGLSHVAHLDRFQYLCEAYGVRPSYLVDYPIATSDEAVGVLAGFLKRGACEIGAHPHPWLNPPQREELTPRNTYLCNLPLELQQEKVEVLTRAIEQAFGERPTTFKAGRYGIDPALLPHLVRLGYTVDTSMIAYTDFSDDGGPSFANIGCRPFWLDDGKKLLEVPCSVGFTRRPFDRWAAVHRRLSNPRWRRLHPIGILDRLGLMSKVVLSPELASQSKLIAVAQAMSREEPPVVYNLTLHSPSVAAGNTPTVQTLEQLEAFYGALEALFRLLVVEWGVRPVTLREYRESRGSCGSARLPPSQMC